MSSTRTASTLPHRVRQALKKIFRTSRRAWTAPQVVLAGETLRVCATREARIADTPDRILQAAPPTE
ncbi:hypothetical protein ACWCQQ_29020 [Streptomyces sp. NPDC002143]